MQLTVQGKQIDVGESLKTHVEEKLSDVNDKYFNRAIEAIVTFSREGHAFIKTHISIHVGKDIMVMSDAVETDPYVSFDEAAAKVAKQLRRYKKRLRDHHQRLEETPETSSIKARDYVLATSPSNDDKSEDTAEEDIALGQDPAVIAELSTSIQVMTVSEAVMRMDLSGQPALLFRNANHDGINMVYKRSDGNVGWVDPEGAEKTHQMAS